MLRVIRKAVDSLFVRILLGLVALSFVGFGGISFLDGIGHGEVVTFSKTEPIPMEKFLQERNKAIAEIQKKYEINLTQDQIASMNLNSEVLSDLIFNHMMKYLASKYDFDISDEKIIEMVKMIPDFHNDKGIFDPMIFKSKFGNNKYNEEEYFKIFKYRMISSALGNIFFDNSYVSEFALNNIFRFMAETKNVDIYKFDLSFTSKDFEPQNPTEDILKTIYESNKKSFIIPEKRSFKYLIFRPEYFEKNIKFTDDNLQQFFDDNKDEYKWTSFKESEQDIKKLFVEISIVEMLNEFNKELENMVASGMNLNEIAQKYDMTPVIFDHISKKELSDKIDSEYITISEPLFEMMAGEVSYPIEIREKNAIAIVELDAIKEQKQLALEEVRSELIDIFNKNQLMRHNLKHFSEFANSNSEMSESKLRNNNITKIKNVSLTKSDFPSLTEYPKELLIGIFESNKGDKTKVYIDKNTAAYFAFVKSEYISETHMKKIMESKNSIQDMIKISVNNSLIESLTEENNMKIDTERLNGL